MVFVLLPLVIKNTFVVYVYVTSRQKLPPAKYFLLESEMACCVSITFTQNSSKKQKFIHNKIMML